MCFWLKWKAILSSVLNILSMKSLSSFHFVSWTGSDGKWKSVLCEAVLDTGHQRQTEDVALSAPHCCTLRKISMCCRFQLSQSPPIIYSSFVHHFLLWDTQDVEQTVESFLKWNVKVIFYGLLNISLCASFRKFMIIWFD